MSILTSKLYGQAARILHDTGHVRWTEAEMLAWINDAQFALVQQRPEAYGQTICHPLGAGAAQTLPDDVTTVFEVPYNLASCGCTEQTLVQDTFTEASTKLVDHSPETGGAWAVDPLGDPITFWYLPSAGTYVTSNGGGSYAGTMWAKQDIAVSEFTITATLDSYNLRSGVWFGTWAGDTAATGYAAIVHWDEALSGELSVGIYSVSDVITPLDEVVLSLNPLDEVPFTLTVEVTAGSVSAYVAEEPASIATSSISGSIDVVGLVARDSAYAEQSNRILDFEVSGCV